MLWQVMQKSDTRNTALLCNPHRTAMSQTTAMAMNNRLANDYCCNSLANWSLSIDFSECVVFTLCVLNAAKASSIWVCFGALFVVRCVSKLDFQCNSVNDVPAVCWRCISSLPTIVVIQASTQTQPSNECRAVYLHDEADYCWLETVCKEGKRIRWPKFFKFIGFNCVRRELLIYSTWTDITRNQLNAASTQQQCAAVNAFFAKAN